MILALWDYCNYWRRKGRYSNEQPDAAMGQNAFVDEVPVEEVARFQVGDIVFTQRLNSFASWAMLYLTSSSVDHVGIYAGDGKIAHRTLEGAGMHSLRSIAKGARVLVVRMSDEELAHWSYEVESTIDRIDKGSKVHHSFPPKIQLLIGGIYLIHGKYTDRFKLRLWSEFFLTITIFFGTLSYFTGIITLLAFPTLSLFALIYYFSKNLLRLLLKKQPITISHPDIGYHAFFKVGGLMFTKMGPIAVTDLGLLPLKIVLGFASQRPDDGSDNKFKEASEFFRDLLKNWNIKGFVEETEQDDAEQHDDE
ncbi:MAG: hypothetical protein WA921_14430 [Ahrensia sp.]